MIAGLGVLVVACGGHSIAPENNNNESCDPAVPDSCPAGTSCVWSDEHGGYRCVDDDIVSCGNGVIDAPEQCDGTALGGQSCAGLGYLSGTLACTAECRLDTAGCVRPSGCGNGILDPGEDCDGNNLGGQSCDSLGFGDGSLGCTPACRFDLVGCDQPPVCGNGVVEYGETCDDGNTEDHDGCSALCQDDCAHACSPAGATRCTGTVIQTCATGGEGCREWQDALDCHDSGEYCDDSGADAVCLDHCPDPPDQPGSPDPADGAVDVDPTAVTSLDWADVAGVTGYAVYFGSDCPPPAYPDAGFQAVTVSELAGASLSESTAYCWQVVAVAAPDCYRVGAVWTFETACVDPVAGPPQVTSGNTNYPAGTTSDVYLLTFNEPVANVIASLTWTPLTGAGTMVASLVDPQTIQVAFSGASNGDEYRLRVGVGVTDHCGNTLAAPVDLFLSVGSTTGQSCADAVDVSGGPFPVQLSGVFETDTAGGSCDPSANNSAWFLYTATETGSHDLFLYNHTADLSWSRIAVFEGGSCEPYGNEIGCVTAEEVHATLTVPLTLGETYLIAFYTDGDQYSMVDPEITIQLTAWSPGEECASPVDLNAVSFPHQETGIYTLDSAGSSCDNTAYNNVFYAYQPPATADYEILVWNHGPDGGTRLAVFNGLSCEPYGVEEDCTGSLSYLALLGTHLTQGTDYLINFYANDDSIVMANPEISVTPAAVDPGEECATAPDLSGASFPHTLPGIFTDDVDGGSCDLFGYNNVFFRFTPTASGWHAISGHNAGGPGDTRLAVFEGASCLPSYGNELVCRYGDSRDVGVVLDLIQNVEYLVMFYVDQNANVMLDPVFDVRPATPPYGDSCDLPSSVGDLYHTVDGNGHDCWTWPGNPGDTTNSHAYACDSVVGGDKVVEYVTGPTQTTLNFEATLTDPQNPPDAYVVVELTGAPCEGGTSEYCDQSDYGTHTLSAPVTVFPSTTYYVFVADGFQGHYLPETTLCLW